GGDRSSRLRKGGVMSAAIGSMLVVAGALALYAASPQQQLLQSSVSRRGSTWSGAVGLLGGLVVLLRWAGPATAVFIALTLASLVWTLVPPIAAWVRRTKESQ